MDREEDVSMESKVRLRARSFLLAGQQLQENFSRILTINKILKEAKINLAQLDDRLARYDQLFNEMLKLPAEQQDWDRVTAELNRNIKELDTYFMWLKDVDKYDIQISQQELERMLLYRKTIQNQVQRLQQEMQKR